MEVHDGVDIHPAAYGGPHAGVDGCTLKEAAACGKSTLEQASARSCDLWRGAQA